MNYTASRVVTSNGDVIWWMLHDIYATNGTPFADTEQGWLAAADASGARDLHCAEKLTARKIARHRSPADFLVDGCGQRATYASDYTSLLLTSIVRLGQ